MEFSHYKIITLPSADLIATFVFFMFVDQFWTTCNDVLVLARVSSLSKVAESLKQDFAPPPVTSAITVPQATA